MLIIMFTVNVMKTKIAYKISFLYPDYRQFTYFIHSVGIKQLKQGKKYRILLNKHGVECKESSIEAYYEHN